MDIKNLKYKIVVDSREKVNNHILNSFDEGFEYQPSHHDMYRGKKETYGDPIPYYIQEKGLKVGDYTIAVQLKNGEVINFKDKFVVERKASLNEICSNFYEKKDDNGKNRLERELDRAKEQGIKVIFLVEEENMADKIYAGKHFRLDKASKVSEKAFNAILRTLQARYDITIEYCRKKHTGRIIHDILYYHAREYLKNID